MQFLQMRREAWKIQDFIDSLVVEGGSLIMCDIEDVVRKTTPVFNILNPFCPRL